jgi:hypothetical protein
VHHPFIGVSRLARQCIILCLGHSDELDFDRVGDIADEDLGGKAD